MHDRVRVSGGQCFPLLVVERTDASVPVPHETVQRLQAAHAVTEHTALLLLVASYCARLAMINAVIVADVSRGECMLSVEKKLGRTSRDSKTQPSVSLPYLRDARLLRGVRARRDHDHKRRERCECGHRVSRSKRGENGHLSRFYFILSINSRAVRSHRAPSPSAQHELLGVPYQQESRLDSDRCANPPVSYFNWLIFS